MIQGVLLRKKFFIVHRKEFFLIRTGFHLRNEFFMFIQGVNLNELFNVLPR